MRRRHLDILRRVATKALDVQRRAVQDHQQTIENLEGVLVGVDRNVAAEYATAAEDTKHAVLLPEYIHEQSVRREQLSADLVHARDELERRIDVARDLFVEMKRYEQLIARQMADEQRAATQRERAFLDWLAARQRFGDG